jgi:hypothetical protein
MTTTTTTNTNPKLPPRLVHFLKAALEEEEHVEENAARAVPPPPPPSPMRLGDDMRNSATSTTTTTDDAHRFLEVLEGLRTRGVSYRMFLEVTELEWIANLGSAFVAHYQLAPMVAANGDKSSVALVQLIVSAYALSLFPTEGREEMINEALVRSVELGAHLVVRVLGGQLRDVLLGSSVASTAAVDTPLAEPQPTQAAFRHRLSLQLFEYHKARKAWQAADAPHLVCRLHEMLVHEKEQHLGERIHSEFIQCLKERVLEAWHKVKEARGDISGARLIKHTWAIRQGTKAKIELKTRKALLVQMQIMWGEEMKDTMRKVERDVVKARAELRAWTGKSVVDDEDRPDRYKVFVPVPSSQEAAFADSFLRLEDEGEDEMTMMLG